MSIRFINNGKSGDGSSILPNIFTSLNEPAKKEGIWLQTDKVAEHYISDNNVFLGGTWKPSVECPTLPFAFSRGDAVIIGNDIYLFGGTSRKTTLTKYNIKTGTVANLTNIPADFYTSMAIGIGTDIYLFGLSSAGTYTYKYDTITNSYTKLANAPNDLSEASGVAIGTNIYLFGSVNQTYNKYAYRYNTLTNTYTRLANIPLAFESGKAIALGNEIYLFGGYRNNRMAYKYNILTNTYTQLTDIPFDFAYGSVIVLGNDIYLLGSDTSPCNFFYKYNILTNAYTKLTNIPNGFYFGASVLKDTDIYLLGGSVNGTAVQIFHCQNKTYLTDNSVVILQAKSSSYNIKLFDTNFEEDYQPLYGIADAWFYTLQDGLITDIPTYYGNGTQWIKFKN